MRNLAFLKDTVRKIWKVIKGAETMIQGMFPKLKDPRYPDLPDELSFFHSKRSRLMYLRPARKQRETLLVQKVPGVFIIGIAGS